MALTDLHVHNAKATGKSYTLGDYDGLSLFISPKGSKAWHFRYHWLGEQSRMSLGMYPELGLRDARAMRDEARALITRSINPRIARKRKQQAARLAGKHTFIAVYERWLAYRALALEEGRQSTLAQIQRVFKKDVIPPLRRMTVHEITRHHLLEVVGRIEKRGSLSVAEKVRTWFRQLFGYAMVIVPDMENNPARDLHVVVVPLPPVQHNPFLRMEEIPSFLRILRTYQGRQVTQLAVRLLLLTGVRTGELRLATPAQFDLERGLWIIPAASLKQRMTLTRKQRKRVDDIPPYIVPLSSHAQEIVKQLPNDFKPAQKYLFPSALRLTDRMSENTVNFALKRMGFDGRLTGHGLRATMSTSLNEIGYPKAWVDAQLSHADPNRIRATYNHAQYVEQRRVMMQDWANRLDLLALDAVEVASQYLVVHLQGLPETPWPRDQAAYGSEVHTPYLQIARASAAMSPTKEVKTIQCPGYPRHERIRLVEGQEAADLTVEAGSKKTERLDLDETAFTVTAQPKTYGSSGCELLVTAQDIVI